jgi:hypothetical protein
MTFISTPSVSLDRQAHDHTFLPLVSRGASSFGVLCSSLLWPYLPQHKAVQISAGIG